MGKFIETTYHDTIEQITGFHSDLLNNSFYTLNDKKPCIVTYYNINRQASSLDPGSKIAYDNIGKDSPIRFNKIEDFIVYGIDKIEIQTDIDEYGYEADKISGDCFVLPNTIVPTEGDYFEIDHIKDATWLFIVTDVQRDTLQNGSNAYKITYKLEYTDNSQIQDNIVDNYKFIEKREGTNIVKVVQSEKYEEAKYMDRIAVTLKRYFYELFYNPAVQTFTYMDLTEWRTYDPFMIEFLIRNKILDNGFDSYVHVMHQLEVPKTFTLDYDTTFYRAFEKKDKEALLGSEFTINLEEIISYGTIFAGRYETYFKTRYSKPPMNYRATCINEDIIYLIYDGRLIDDKEPKDKLPLWINIFVKHFSGEKFTKEEIDSIMKIRFETSLKEFYAIPLLIYCLECAIENALN